MITSRIDRLAKVAYEVYHCATREPCPPWATLASLHKESCLSIVKQWTVDGLVPDGDYNNAYHAAYAATMALHEALHWGDMKEQQAIGLEVRLEDLGSDIIVLQLRHEKERQLREACQQELESTRSQLAALVLATGTATLP